MTTYTMADIFSVLCVFVTNVTRNIWAKWWISMFPVLQGNVETVIKWGGKYSHFSIGYFLRNMSANNIDLKSNKVYWSYIIV